ncbi:hypothetical protein AGOR_G00174840 [Albula goreensis]|uniref:Uncharacterized protein n=1 Tax=Albula goreensis TaxID=1534307 RepID=A0A8T3D326_9TELE|nr:hypothetical protein AGOR_G00174840 [Albula goreensis]
MYKTAAQLQVPSSFEGQVPECLPAYSLVADIGPAGRHRHCGHIACYDGAGNRVSLGRTRSEASVQIQELWSRGWLDRYTRAVMVQFTLYNPPTNLFTTVSLLVEQPTTGGLLPSAFIDSVRLYQTSSPFHYTIMACELLFLLLTLLQLYFQMCAMSQKGLLAYWHDTCNWLEITIIIVSLFYYIYYVYHFILAVEIIDDFQKDNFKEFVDLGFISSWEQFTRCLHGIMGFLLLVKCISLLQTNRTMAPSVTLLKMSLSKFPWLLVTGVILMISFASLGNLLFLSGSHSFSSLIRSFQTVVTHWPGVSKLKTLSMLYQPNNVSITLFYGSFFFSMSIVWTALIIGTLSSFVKTVKKKTLRGKHLMNFSEVAAYIQDRILVFLGRREYTWRDNHAQRSNFYFDEFENLVDELLLLVNAFTSSLYNTLPSKEQGYQGRLLTFQPEYTCSLDTEDEAAGEDNLKKKKTSQFEGRLFKNNPDMYSLLLTYEIGSLFNSHFRSNIELETLWHLQQSQHQNPLRTWSEGSMEASSMYHTDWPEEESRKDTAETSTVLPGSVQVLETPSSPSPCSDPYNLAQLGDDLPHILCGTRCPEKQAAHSKTLQIRMNRSSMDLSAKSRKLLKRSRATVIQPLGGAINGGITGAVSQGTLEAVSALCPDPTQPSAEAAALTVKPTVLQWSGGKYKGDH